MLREKFVHAPAWSAVIQRCTICVRRMTTGRTVVTVTDREGN
jgi:hypothetical protein